MARRVPVAALLPVADTTAFPFLISVMWTYDGKRNEGMPDDGTLSMMDRVEDETLVRKDGSIVIVVSLPICPAGRSTTVPGAQEAPTPLVARACETR